MFDSSTTIAQFLNATAAKTPTPGGGSVSALVAAEAAALGEMVINYSLNKKGLEAFADELKPALAEMNKARSVLLQLMVEDQLAYDAFSAAKTAGSRAPGQVPRRPAHLRARPRDHRRHGRGHPRDLRPPGQLRKLLSALGLGRLRRPGHGRHPLRHLQRPQQPLRHGRSGRPPEHRVHHQSAPPPRPHADPDAAPRIWERIQGGP